MYLYSLRHLLNEKKTNKSGWFLSSNHGEGHFYFVNCTDRQTMPIKQFVSGRTKLNKINTKNMLIKTHVSVLFTLHCWNIISAWCILSKSEFYFVFIENIRENMEEKKIFVIVLTFYHNQNFIDLPIFLFFWMQIFHILIWTANKSAT